MKEALIAHIGKDSEGDKTLLAIANKLIAAQKTCGYRGEVDIHAYDRSMSICCTDISNLDLNETAFAEMESALQDFAGWIHSQLTAEWEYFNSDKPQVDETLCANEYEFTAEGKKA